MLAYRDPVEEAFEASDDSEDWDEDEIKSLVQQELAAALGQDGGTLSHERLKAQQYYNGEAIDQLAPIEGRSAVVMRTVLEACEWVLPQLLRIFTASEKICIVEPPFPGLEDKARSATDYLNHIFYRDNDGFMLLRDWFADALLEKVGWVKFYWDTQRDVEIRAFSGLTQEQFAAIIGTDEDVEIVSQKKYIQPADEFLLDRAVAAPVPVQLIDVTLRITRTNGRVRLRNVPPEEVLFSRRAKRDDLKYLCHRRSWTYSDLVQQGYDEDCLDEIPGYDQMEWNSERVERFRLDDSVPPDEREGAQREIWVEENYAYLSKDGRTAELYKVTTAAGGLIILTKDGKFDIECVDCIPFVPICPIPQSHKLVGMSLADLTMDLQVIKSTLLRQILDNGYLSNFPRTEVADDVVNENTYDDLINVRPAGLIRTRRVGGLQPFIIPYTADKTFPLVEYMDHVAEGRTGVSPMQAIGPDALNRTVNSTASGMALAQNAAAQRVELFARIFAFGVEQLMKGVLELCRRHQQQERIIRVTGGWQQIDPREWRDSMPVTVSVGLGTGNRDQILAQLMQVIQLQGTIVAQQGGVNGPLVYAGEIYSALKALQENAGFKTPFFHDPSTPPPPGTQPQQGPPPDPAMQKAQAAIAAAQQKAQAEAQIGQQKAAAEAQIGQQKAQLEAQLAQQRLQHEMALEETRLQHEMELERQKSQNDIAIEQARSQAQAEAQLAEIKLKYAAGAYSPQPPQSTNGSGGGA